MGIGRNIKSLIDKQNKTINEVATSAQINPQTLYAIIKRDKPDQKVSPGILLKVANALDVTVNQLIDGFGLTNNADYDNPEYYSRALYAFRASQGLTPKEFAQKTGIPEATIKSWENRGWEPRLRGLWNILDAFKVSIEELFPDSEHAKELMQSEFREVLDSRIKENILIDVTFNPNHPINDVMQEIRSGKELTEEGKKVLNNFLESGFSQEAIEHTTFLVSSLGKNLKYLYSIYKQLNEEGQEKVLEHAEMIAKIPEYRKGTADPTEE